MSDLLAEVDEVIRQEKLLKFWQENGSLIIAFIVITILSTAGFSTYRTWDANVKTKQTEQLIELSKAENYPTNILDDELKLRPSLRGIALLTAAGTFMQKNNKDDAQKLYARLANDTKIPSDLRDLGILMNARITSDNADADTAEILASLQPILKGKSPWKPHAQIDAALLYAKNPATVGQALALLNAVLDSPELPSSLYGRAEKLHHVIEQMNNTPETKTN